MLKLYQSNQLEILSQRLAELLAMPTQQPLQPETLIVQHPGMARWIALDIAAHSGICANVRFPLPATLIWEVFQAFLPDVPVNNRFDPSLLNWRIFALLDDLRDAPLFQPIQHYLKDKDELRRFQLADRLSMLFDRYLLYRPDWILRWQSGQVATPGDAWQAELWRQLVVDSESHWVELQQALAAYQGDLPEGLPQRLFLIGVPTLSPGYLQIIQWLAQWIDIHLFLLNPCAAHWAEIVDLQEQAKRELKADGSELYLDVGNPLLASLGRQGRDFFANINEFDPGSEEWFIDPGDATLLQHLQQQILTLEMSADTAEPDNSISFQICHSPMREVEVLYDQLLAMLEQTPELTPSEILVMTPDIETYAPLLEAVFAVVTDRPAIPYRISDLAMQQESRHAAALLELLELPGSRFNVNQLLGLLEIPAIGQHFGLDETALEQLVDWIAAANIRWGQDGQSKIALGLPAESSNTWRAGLDRLLLGFAMPAESEQLWQGIAPLNAAEGSMTAWLGGLLAFCEAIFNLQEQLSEPRDVTAWSRQLLDVCENFFSPDKTPEQPLQQIRQTIQQLRDEAEAANFTQEISLPLIRQRLERAFATKSQRGFLGGGVNVCSLAPMRSLPFQVICLLGMNEGSFPREQPRLSFDLMSRQFRLGDRSRRADDRYLFLETLISARRHLYISYVGRSIKDNSALPPAVVIDELRDYLASQMGTQGLREITHQHPLQPFSADYFSRNNPLYSYSTRMREAALLVGHGGAETKPLVSQTLHDTAEAALRQVELSQLINFYTNPARTFARQRLNLQLESGSYLLDEREPFALTGFARDELEVEMVNALLVGETDEALYQRMSASGVLPHGNPGRGQYQQLLLSAKQMTERVESLRLGEELQTIDFDQPLGEGSLHGRLRRLYQQGQFSFRVGKIYPHQMLDLWIHHLVLNWLQPAEVGLQTIWLEREGCGHFTPVPEAAEYLQQLLGYYRKGMQAPLHFYPGSSWAYAEKLLTQGDPEAAYNAAINKWQGNDYYPGDQAKPYHQLLHYGPEMLDAHFFTISQAVFEPLMRHLEDSG